MKKKFMILILTLILIVAFVPNAFAQGDYLKPIFSNFEFSDDLTKVKVGNVTYDNIVYLSYYPNENKLFFTSAFHDYLLGYFSNLSPREYLEKYVPNEIVRTVSNPYFNKGDILEAQVLMVNYEPWLGSKYSELYFENIERDIKDGFIPEDEVRPLLNNIKSGKALTDPSTIKNAAIKVSNYALSKNATEYRQNKLSDAEYVKLNNINELKDVILEITEENKEKDKEIEKPVEPKINSILLKIDSNIVHVKGQTKTMDVAPINPAGVTLIPVRGVLDELGAKLEWLPESKQVKVTYGQNVIYLTIGSKIAMVNNQPVSLLAPAEIVNNRTLIPLRFVSENLGFEVKWFAETQKITIN